MAGITHQAAATCQSLVEVAKFHLAERAVTFPEEGENEAWTLTLGEFDRRTWAFASGRWEWPVNGPFSSTDSPPTAGGWNPGR